MKENTKFKMVFGKKVAQKEFSCLQNNSKLLKPASLNKLLGKRSWNLKQIRELQDSEEFIVNKKRKKKRKIARSRSFCEEIKETGALTFENTQKIFNHCFPNPKFYFRDYQKKHDHFKKQVNFGRTDLRELSTAENFEDYLAYNLCKANYFLRKKTISLN